MYTVSETLHAGSQGVLYRGIRDADQQAVLLKVLAARYRPEQFDRLKNEYAIGKTLDSVAVLKPLALDTYQGLPALVMEDCCGGLLSRQFDIPMAVERFLPLALRIATAVADIHQHNIVHKDLKPENILVNAATGEVKIVGFGIASTLPCAQLTIDSTTLGDDMLPYMSPEQVIHTNRTLDQRSDLYSLGVMFYQMLIGKLPRLATDPQEAAAGHVTPPVVLLPSLPEALSAIVMKLLANKVEERYQSAHGLRHDLELIQTQWQAGGTMETFPLALQDGAARTRFTAGVPQLDVLSVVKASQALSGEITFDRLLSKLLQIVLVQAGAQKGFVVLKQQETLTIEAQALLDEHGSVTVDLLYSLPVISSSLLPISVISYAWRTRQTVLLENAATAPKFSADDYIIRTQPKSVLCQPIFKQAELVGLLYLENNLASGAFTSDVQAVLELLASQAAISLENARLYTHLTDENTERERVEKYLQVSEAHYRRLFETAKDGILLLDFETGRITDVNSFLIEMLGYGYNEFLGQVLWETGPFKNVSASRTAFSELHTKETIRYEYLPLETKDGQRIDVEFVSSVYQVDDAKVVQCNIRDITDRKRAEQRQVVQFAVTRALAEAASFADAVLPLLKVICENFGWEIGELWSVDRHADLLRLIESWEAPILGPNDFVAAGRRKVFGPGIGLPGRVWQNHQPAWVPDVAEDPEFQRTEQALKIGMHGAFSFPIMVSGQVTNIMTFFSHGIRQPDEDMINMMSIIGSQIGQFIERKRTEQALIESEERFRSLTGLSSDWYWEQDEKFRYTLLSDGVLRIGGLHPEHFIGKTRWDMPVEIDAIEQTAWAAHRAVLEAHQPFQNLEYKVRGEDGRFHWYSISGEPLFDALGSFKGYRGTGTEITERKQAETLRVGQARVLEMIATGAPLEAVLASLVRVIESQSEGMLGSILLLGDDGQHVRSGVAPSLPGSYAQTLEGAAIGPQAGSCGTAMYRRQRVIVTDIRQDPLWTDYRDFAAQYDLRACWSTPILSHQGKVLGTFGMYYRDVRSPLPAEIRLADIATRIAGIAIERKQAEERISYMAHHDALTGLPNRALLQDRLHQAIAQAQRTETAVAVLFIDLDYFKHINDSLGHLVGDHLLQMVATRLQPCLRKGDSLARLGGDEFVLILPMADSHAAAVVADKALESVDLSFMVDGHDLHVSASIGISLYPNDGEDAETLMRAADIAMYHAKEKGRDNYQYFTESLNAAAQHRLVMANQLRLAMTRGEFSLHYQPQVDMENGRIFSAEALLRWRQPERGNISPVEFIPIVEETGQILQLGEWVLREACAQLKRWRDAGHLNMAIAVNLSARQVLQHGFADTVAHILDEFGLPATALDLEITETILMQPSEENLATLIQLSNMGIQLSVDDFGTGYSSLSYLKRFPIHAVKIDQSFVRGIGQDPNDMAIANTIIAMAHSLHLKVIAEGVETAEQATFLISHGCLSAQGYYYSKPVSADAFTALLCRQTASGSNFEAIHAVSER